MIFLLLQALFLWLIVSTLMVGGAILFHRLFPDESPWFGFIVPPLVLVVVFNFTEHFIALPGFLILLPLALGGTLWMIVGKGWYQPALNLPVFVFLASFAFTLGIRCLEPNIDFTSDGVSDLNMVNNYSQGHTLPPIDTWMPDQQFEWYYGLQHYAASVLERLLNVKIGVAYNVAFALLSALICVVGATAAHRISGGKTWITLATLLLIEGTATGSAAYLFLTVKNCSVWLPPDMSGGVTHPPDGSKLWDILRWDPRPGVNGVSLDDIGKNRILRLQVPGFWTWRSEYHANASGHLLSLLSVAVIAEIVYVRRTLWPWVLAAVIPILAVAASAWALPITVLMCWGILPIAWFYDRRPASSGLTFLAIFIGLTLLWPVFYNSTSSPVMQQIMATRAEWRVPVFEFLFQWWPILLLWISGWICWRDMSFGLRWIMFVLPIMLIGIEFITIESRYNTIEKMWGYTWGMALIGLFPFVATRPAIVFRMITGILLLSAAISFFFYSRDVVVSAYKWPAPVMHLSGDAYIRGDEQKNKLLQVMTPYKRATFLSGKCDWCYNESPTLAAFTGNRSFIAWSWFESLVNYQQVADRRAQLNNDFYAGAMKDRLKFLQDNNITGVMIWPDDNISDDALTALHTDLDSAYDYVDCKGSGGANAGMFLRRSTMSP